MNEKQKKVFQTLVQSAKSAGTAIGQFVKDCKEQEDWMAAQRLAAIRQSEQEQFRASYKLEYDNFTDAVRRCLRRNYSQCGLFEPELRVDLECEIESNNIDGNPNNVIFRHEIEREPIGATIHTLGGVKCVPVEEIERRLQSELPKYAREKGYGFRRLSVTDIGKNKIRIETAGVYRLNPGGMMVW